MVMVGVVLASIFGVANGSPEAGAAPCSYGAHSGDKGLFGGGACSKKAPSPAWPHPGRTGGRGSSGPAYVCEDTLTEIDIEFLAESLSILGEIIPARPSPDSTLRRIRCTIDGVLVGDTLRWFEPGAGIDLDAIGQNLIRDFADELLLPRLSVATDPITVGLVGLDTWFWIDGWDGEPMTRSVVEAGFPFELRLELTSVTWAFGDGSRQTAGSVGAPYPAADGVTHRYDERSTSEANPEGTFTVEAAVVVAASYSVNGGPFVNVDPITDQSTVDYLVREAQALIR